MGAGEVVWITGGGSGIGRAIALVYAARGARVAVSGRREDRLAEAVTAISAAGGEGLAVRCDVTDEDDVAAAVQRILDTWGRLDVAIANAGFGVGGRIEEVDAAGWNRQLAVNVVGAATTARLALPHLRQTGGRLGLVGSVSAWFGIPANGPYVASKAAVRAMGKTLSTELAGSGVSCTTLHPGFVESEIGQVDNDGVYHEDWKDRRPSRFMWPTDRAAAVMVRAMDRRRGQFVFTGHGRLAVLLGQHLPGLAQWILERSAKKTYADRAG